MESPLSLFRMHWDPEPANRAIASWTAPVLWRFRLARLHCQSARGLAHSKTWRGLRRFMESPHDFDAVRWDPEPAREIQSTAAAVHSKTRRKFERLWPTLQRLG